MNNSYDKLYKVKVLKYNYKQINSLRNFINKTAQQTEKIIIKKLHDNIVAPISNTWYGPEAIDFFQKFAAFIENSFTNINQAFDSLRVNIEITASNLNKNIINQKFILEPIDIIDFKFNTLLNIQTDIKETIIVDKQEINKIENNLLKIKEELRYEIEELIGNLNYIINYSIQGQSDSLKNISVIINKEIDNIFEYLTNDNNSLKAKTSNLLQ